MNNQKRHLTAAAGFVMMFFAGVFYAWSLFRIALSEFFPAWTASDYSLNFTIFIICFCSAGLLGGRLSGRLGNRKALWLGAAMILAGGLLFSFLRALPPAAALPAVYLSYGVLCGAGSGIAYNVIISGVGTLFQKNGGLVSGILLTGFGFGSLFLGVAVQELAARIGFFDAFRVLTALITAVLLLFSGLLPDARNAAPAAAADAPEDGFTPSQMLRTSTFWLYMVWVIFMNSAGLLVINNAANIAAYFGAFAALGMIVSLVNGFARIGSGAFFDRFGSRRSILVNTACAIAAGALLLAADLLRWLPLMFAGLIAAGISYGATMALNASVIKELFGKKHFSLNFSMITLSGIPASILGPYISGVLQDRANGAYTTTFAAICVFALLSLLLCLILWRKIAGIRKK